MKSLLTKPFYAHDARGPDNVLVIMVILECY